MKVFISPVHYFMDRKFYGSEVEESFFILLQQRSQTLWIMTVR